MTIVSCTTLGVTPCLSGGVETRRRTWQETSDSCSGSRTNLRGQGRCRRTCAVDIGCAHMEAIGRAVDEPYNSRGCRARADGKRRKRKEPCPGRDPVAAYCCAVVVGGWLPLDQRSTVG